MVSIFDKEQKIALRNPACRHSKARKIPSVFKDVPRNVFFRNWGLKRLHFSWHLRRAFFGPSSKKETFQTTILEKEFLGTSFIMKRIL